ncbi:unnamed protein product [Sphagnum balticum]
MAKIPECQAALNGRFPLSLDPLTACGNPVAPCAADWPAFVCVGSSRTATSGTCMFGRRVCVRACVRTDAHSAPTLCNDTSTRHYTTAVMFTRMLHQQSSVCRRQYIVCRRWCIDRMCCEHQRRSARHQHGHTGVRGGQQAVCEWYVRGGRAVHCRLRGTKRLSPVGRVRAPMFT